MVNARCIAKVVAVIDIIWCLLYWITMLIMMLYRYKAIEMPKEEGYLWELWKIAFLYKEGTLIFGFLLYLVLIILGVLLFISAGEKFSSKCALIIVIAWLAACVCLFITDCVSVSEVSNPSVEAILGLVVRVLFIALVIPFLWELIKA